MYLNWSVKKSLTGSPFAHFSLSPLEFLSQSFTRPIFESLVKTRDYNVKQSLPYLRHKMNSQVVIPCTPIQAVRESK